MEEAQTEPLSSHVLSGVTELQGAAILTSDLCMEGWEGRLGGGDSVGGAAFCHLMCQHLRCKPTDL